MGMNGTGSMLLGFAGGLFFGEKDFHSHCHLSCAGGRFRAFVLLVEMLFVKPFNACNLL